MQGFKKKKKKKRLIEIIVSTSNAREKEKGYRNVRKCVIEGLCNSGLYQTAITLAQNHSDIPALIVAVQTSNLHDIQKTHIQYIDEYGEEYFKYLLVYLDGTGAGNEYDGRIMELLTKYPTHARNFLEENEVNVAWIYHHRQKDYEKSLKSLKICIRKEKNEYKLKLYESWKQILMAALQQ